MRKIQYAALFLDLAVALFLFLRIKFKGYIFILFIYIATISAITAIRFILSEELGEKLYYVSAIVHFSLLALLFHSIDNPRIKNSKSLTFTIFWFIVLFILIVANSYKDWMLIGAFSNAGLFILAAYYFYKLFSSINPGKIFTVPAFWIVTGVFICKSIALPMMAFFYLLNSESILDSDTVNSLFSIGAIGYIIMHLFFIGSFVCILLNRRSAKEICS